MREELRWMRDGEVDEVEGWRGGGGGRGGVVGVPWRRERAYDYNYGEDGIYGDYGVSVYPVFRGGVEVREEGEIDERDDEEGMMERATERKIAKSLHAIEWAMYEIDGIAKQAIEDLQVTPPPVRVTFRDPWIADANKLSKRHANSNSNGTRNKQPAAETTSEKIPNDRTPGMVHYEAEIQRITWLRLKSRYEFIANKHLVDLRDYSDVLAALGEGGG